MPECTALSLILFRVISVGSQGYILNNQEPKNDSQLPVDDYAWVRSVLCSLQDFASHNPI